MTDMANLSVWSVWRSITAPNPWFEGANIFYRRRALEETDGFNEDFATWGEDTELGWAVVDSGWERGFARGAVAIHEVEQRGWRHAARFAWRDRNVIQIAAAHPQFRHEAFWRPWAVHRRNVEVAVAIVGVTASFRWRPAALLALPYLWLRRPPIRKPGFFRTCAQIGAVDAARFAGNVRGSIANRIIVL